MSSLIKQILKKASTLNRHIVLPEGSEPRTLRAARIIVDKKIAKVTLIGNFQEMKKIVPDISLDGFNVIDPDNDDLKKYSDLLYQVRSAKGMTVQEAEVLCKNPLYLGVLLVHSGECDGMVAGAINATGDVLRPALQIIKTPPNISTVSSCFVMVLKQATQSGDEILVMGDCAVNANPTDVELASIAISTADSAKAIAGIDPKVAMLSFSTKGSAKHVDVDKVRNATALVKQQRPELDIDGELQVDAALIDSVGKLKSPNSTIAGKANVLIFPNLDSGNIGYKLVQRLAGAEAIGPICQGFKKPVNDLSRGCSIEDIVNVVAITALQV